MCKVRGDDGLKAPLRGARHQPGVQDRLEILVKRRKKKTFDSLVRQGADPGQLPGGVLIQFICDDTKPQARCEQDREFAEFLLGYRGIVKNINRPRVKRTPDPEAANLRSLIDWKFFWGLGPVIHSFLEDTFVDTIDSETALTKAVEANDVDFVRLLLAHGADPAVPKSVVRQNSHYKNVISVILKRTPLMLAVHGKTHCDPIIDMLAGHVRSFQTKFPKPIHLKDECNLSVLERLNLQPLQPRDPRTILRRLLRSGADPYFEIKDSTHLNIETADFTYFSSIPVVRDTLQDVNHELGKH